MASNPSIATILAALDASLADALAVAPQDSATGSVPIWLLRDSEVSSWRATQPTAVASWLDNNDFRGERHRVLLLPRPDGTVAGAVLGLGSLPAIEALSPWAIAGLPEKLPPGSYRFARDLPSVAADHAVLGWLLGSLPSSPLRSGSKVGTGGVTRRARLCPPSSCDLVAVTREALVLGWSRELINLPPNLLGPAELSALAAAMGAGSGACTEVIVGDELLAADYPMIHAVGRAAGRAAERAPRLIDLRWGDERHPKVTIVGKGVCFDSGGLDIKPGAAMALMKKDMGGAAVALGLARLLMERQAPIRLRVLVPAVENSVGGDAYRPGDVLRSRRGLTVEINNTDAEGRLVLADALWEACSESPALLLDFATLTGAARTALGPELPALFSNDPQLLASAQRCGVESHDPAWPMPLWDSYDDELTSRVADLSNVAPSAFAGAVFGALFLRRFVAPAVPWAHFDLYAWNPRERPGRPVGGEAQCLRLADRLIRDRFG
jgi:leucyl aminopeptidase